MTPADLSLTVLHAVRSAVDEGVLRVAVPERVRIERPRPGGRGDYASNVALTLARAAQRPPLDVAAILRDRLHASPALAAVEITGPGFLNFTLRQEAQQDLVREILRRGPRYGWREPTPETGETHETGAGSTPETGETDETGAGSTPETGETDETGTGSTPETHETGAGSTLETAATPDNGNTARTHTTAEPPRLRHRPDLRAAVTADALRRILLSQGIAVRTTCDGPVPSEWELLQVETAPGEESSGEESSEEGEEDAPALAPLPVPDTPRDLLHRLGVDAARWGLLSVAAHDRARLGDELLHQHEGNPLFRVRYAHSRTRALVRNAAQLGFRSETCENVDAPALTQVLGDHPVVLASAARHRAPDRVARHLEATADALLDFQHTVLPLGDEKPSAAHRSRLALAEAAGVVLAGGLSLLGISAPDQM